MAPPPNPWPLLLTHGPHFTGWRLLRNNLSLLKLWYFLDLSFFSLLSSFKVLTAVWKFPLQFLPRLLLFLLVRRSTSDIQRGSVCRPRPRRQINNYRVHNIGETIQHLLMSNMRGTPNYKETKKKTPKTKRRRRRKGLNDGLSLRLCSISCYCCIKNITEDFKRVFEKRRGDSSSGRCHRRWRGAIYIYIYILYIYHIFIYIIYIYI